MTLPSSGPISFNDLKTEFQGATPVPFNNYYKGGALVPTTAGGNIPVSGAIQLDDFYNAQLPTLGTSSNWTTSSPTLTASTVFTDVTSTSTVYQTTSNGGLFKSTDSGLTFTQINTGISGGLHCASGNTIIRFAPAQFVNDTGYISQSTDGGITFTNRVTLSNTASNCYTARSVCMNNSGVCIAVGYSRPALDYTLTPRIWRSLDGGVTWASFATPATFFTVSFENGRFCAACTSVSGFHTSTDGINWSAITGAFDGLGSTYKSYAFYAKFLNNKYIGYGGLYTAGDYTGNYSNTLYIGTDLGATITPLDIPLSSVPGATKFRIMDFDYVNGLYIASGYSDAPAPNAALFLTSPDLATWTYRQLAITNVNVLNVCNTSTRCIALVGTSVKSILL